MELKEILNPPDEAPGIDAGAGEDLFNVVMEARRGEEGRHDGDDTNTDTPGESTPTPTEALQVTSTIIRYIKDKRRCIFSRVGVIVRLIRVRAEEHGEYGTVTRHLISFTS